MMALWVVMVIGAAQDAAKPPQNRDEIFAQDIQSAIQKLGSDKHTESYVAREELIEMGRRSVPAVVAELQKKDVKPAVKRALCEILGRVRDPQKDAVAALIAKLKDADEYGTSIAAAAARSLAALGDEGAISPLVELLKSPGVEIDKPLKYECIRALGLLRAREASEALRKALEDKKPASVSDDDTDAHLIAAAAAEALGFLRAQDAVEDLGKILSDVTPDNSSDLQLGVHAARALQRILAHELRGKTEKDEPRAGTLSGDPAEITKTHEAWKKWWDERRGKVDVAGTQATLAKVAAAVEAFKKDQGKYPDALDQLKTKPADAKSFPKDGYFQGELKDAWGRAFHLRNPGTGADFDLLSYGKDGAAWGGGDNADLYNHDKWIEIKKAESRKAVETAVQAVEKFKADQGRYPADILDLQNKPPYSLAKEWPKDGYLKEIPRDGFGNLLKFSTPGTGGEPFDLKSLGADNAAGGTGADEDLWNHAKRPAKPDEKKDEKK